MFDVSPNVLKIYEVKIQGQSILLCCQLVSNGVSIITEKDFLIGGIDLVDEGEVEPLPALLAQGLIIRFDIHSFIIIQQLLKYSIILQIQSYRNLNHFCFCLGVNIFNMSYEMKKALRRSVGAKSYA